MEGLASGVRPLENGRYSLLSLATQGHVAFDIRGVARASRRAEFDRLGYALYRQHRGSSPPARSWWKKGAPRALGRSRGGLGTKIHLRTDCVGNPLAFTITAGQEHDAPQLTKLIDLAKIKRAGRGRPRVRPDFLAGDKGYDSSQLRAELRQRGITPVIPARSNRKRAIKFDRERYRSRNVIERCFNRLKQWRRLATRYEKHGVNYVAVVLIAASMHFVNLLL